MADYSRAAKAMRVSFHSEETDFCPG